MTMPVLVLIACMFIIPFFTFSKRVRKATQTYNLAQRFRDLVMVAVGTDSNVLNGFISDLNDTERMQVEETMGICFAKLFGLQPSDSVWKRQLIADLPEGSNTTLYADENVILSKLVHQVKDDPLYLYTSLKERVFVQWYLDEVTMAYYKKYGNAPELVDLFDEIVNLSGDERPPRPQHVYLEKEYFSIGSRKLCPVLTHEECVRCFEIVDTRGEGSLDKEKFFIVFNGMGGECAQTAKTNSKNNVIAQKEVTKAYVADVREPVEKTKSDPPVSMRDAMTKLHVLLEGEDGVEMRLRSNRQNAAASKLQKTFKQKSEPQAEEVPPVEEVPEESGNLEDGMSPERDGPLLIIENVRLSPQKLAPRVIETTVTAVTALSLPAASVCVLPQGASSMIPRPPKVDDTMPVWSQPGQQHSL